MLLSMERSFGKIADLRASQKRSLSIPSETLSRAEGSLSPTSISTRSNTEEGMAQSFGANATTVPATAPTLQPHWPLTPAETSQSLGGHGMAAIRISIRQNIGQP